MIRALITQREEQNRYGDRVDSLEISYIEYFDSLGVQVYPVPNHRKSAERQMEYSSWDVLILTGGGLLPKQFYLRDHPGDEQNCRDEVELELIKAAIDRGIPVIGICRGMQMLNGYFGGKADKLENLRETRTIRKDHEAVIPETGEEFFVNHYHSDGIYRENLGKGLVPAVMDSANDVVEAFVAEHDPVLGIQWHPERPLADIRGRDITKKMILEQIRK